MKPHLYRCPEFFGEPAAWVCVVEGRGGYEHVDGDTPAEAYAAAMEVWGKELA